MSRWGNGRQMRKVALVCVLFALPALTQAAKPPPNAQALGITEGVLHYCGSVDPKAAGQLQQKAKDLVQGLSEDEVAKLRESEEYRAAYDSIGEMLTAAPGQKAVQACASADK
jgi:hypothetical protein